MTEQHKSTTEERVPCEVCLKEIPVSEAKVAEAEDYVHHFCGLECYEQWKKREQKAEEELLKINGPDPGFFF